MANIGLIIAGGSGARMQQEIPKQFLNVNDKPVIIYTLEAFQNHPDIDAIAVVCVKGWEMMLEAYARQFRITKLVKIVNGGDCGQASIRNGLFALEEMYDKDDIVLIHDAIRPMVSQKILTDCINTVKQYGSGITVIPCAEAMLETSNQISSTSSYPRSSLKRTQTPQGFRLGNICDIHRRAIDCGILNSVASCTLMIEMGQEVHFCPGSEKNIKLTTVDDLDIFQALLHSVHSDWIHEDK